MDTALLEVFREVCRRGSFTAAADALSFTQSAVSRQVAALERHTEATLFDRQPRGVRLTDEGRCLLGHAEAVLDRLASARRDLHAIRTLSAGRLHIGSFATADAALVPRAMAAFHTQHPGVALSLTEALSPVQTSRLRDGELDVGVISLPSGRPIDTSGLDLTHLLNDHMLIAIPTGHRLGERTTLRLADLSDEHWIAGWENPEDTLIGTALPAGFEPNIRYVIPGWTAKLGLVAAGLGVTVIPSLATTTARTDVMIKQLHPDDIPARPVYAATRSGTSQPAVPHFLRALSGVVQEMRTELDSDSPEPPHASSRH